MNIKETSIKVYENAKNKGFYNKPVETGTRLMLITSELAEALEAHRKNRFANIPGYESNKKLLNWKNEPNFFNKEQFEHDIKDTFEDEIADAFIRLMDLCAFMGIDIEYHIKEKMRYNSTREEMHGGKAY